MILRNLSNVAIIIVTYEGIEYIDDCLRGLTTQDYDGAYGVIVVDNSSKDGTPEFVFHSYPRVTLLRNEENLGFAGGSNVGIAHALKNGCDAVVLVNQDTLVPPDFLANLVNGAMSDERIGAAQALILLYPEKNLINSAGNALHYLGFGYTKGYRRTEDEYTFHMNVAVLDTAYPSGAAVLLKRKALEDVGWFDERLFLYHEDLDLGWRLHLRKWRVVVVHEARIWHKYSFEKSISKYYYMERNRLNVIFKNYRVRTILLILPMLFITEIGIVFSSLRGGYFYEFLRALFAFLHPDNLGSLLKSRKAIEKTRLVSDREFSEWLTSEVVFQDVDSPLIQYIANPLWGYYWRLIRHFL